MLITVDKTQVESRLIRAYWFLCYCQRWGL